MVENQPFPSHALARKQTLPCLKYQKDEQEVPLRIWLFSKNLGSSKVLLTNDWRNKAQWRGCLHCQTWASFTRAGHFSDKQSQISLWSEWESRCLKVHLKSLSDWQLEIRSENIRAFEELRAFANLLIWTWNGLICYLAVLSSNKVELRELVYASN